jgi:hypothetical protein
LQSKSLLPAIGREGWPFLKVPDSIQQSQALGKWGLSSGIREILMTAFTVGDRVIIRYGTHQGQKGTVIKAQDSHVYEVKVEDGHILFFSEKGLDKEKVST